MLSKSTGETTEQNTHALLDNYTNHQMSCLHIIRVYVNWVIVLILCKHGNNSIQL